ncbi:MAG: diacylglycerol/lipid kinase family protein [Crocinitomicaceae bacterium]
MNIKVIINGKKKLSILNQRILHLLESSEEVNLNKHYTTAPLDAINYVQLNLKDNDIVVCVGGDGTCNEVLNGVVLSKKQNIGLVVLPDGTGNDFVRSTTPITDQIVERILSGEGEMIDIGKVSSKKGTNRYFLNIAGFGLDGKVVEIMDRQRANGFGGGMSYSSAIIRGFFSFRKPSIKLTSDNFTYEGKVLLVAFCNGSTYGNGLVISPDSKVNDMKMEVCVFGDLTVWHYIKYLGKIKKGIKIDHPEVFYFCGNEVTVSSGKALAGQLDGEYHAFDDAKVELVPSRIRLINKII